MKTEQMKRIKLFGIFIILLVATQSCVVSSLHPLYTDSDRVHLNELDGVWQEDDKTRYEITTIVDTTGLEDQLKNLESVSKIKHKAGSKLKVKYRPNNNASVSKDSITGQVVVSGTLDHDQIMHYLYPDTRKHYQIKVFDKKDTSVFDGILSKLDEYYFLDLIPNDNCVGDKIGDSNIGGMLIRTHGFFKIELEGDQLKVNTIVLDAFEDLIKKQKVRIEHIERDDKLIITAKTPEIQKFLIKFADTEIFNDPDEALMLKRIK